MSGDPRAQRVAENEAAFRSVNERVEQLAERLDVDPEFLCECARPECAERLSVPSSEYEAVRAHPARFVLVPGHEDLRYERVVDDRGEWLVVEKTGEAGDEAAREDPRGA